MVGPEFASCLLKIGHAEEHLNIFNTERLAWIQGEPYVISKKVEAEGRRHSAVLGGIRNPPPLDRWSLIAGDCIHNLRSALDHAAYALAIRDSGQSPPPAYRSIQFPIVGDSKDWPAERDRRLGSLSAASRARIERLQPYNRGHHDLPPLLSLVSHFDNTDKHRLLNLASEHLVGGKFRLKTAMPTLTPYFLKTPINSGTEAVMFFEVDPPNLDVDYDYEPSFDITVSHPQGPSGAHVSLLKYILEILIAEVKAVVNLAVL